jgi:hypothetical protein
VTGSRRVANGIRGLLPRTSGDTALWVLGVGILPVVVGHLVRKLAR